MSSYDVRYVPPPPKRLLKRLFLFLWLLQAFSIPSHLWSLVASQHLAYPLHSPGPRYFAIRYPSPTSNAASRTTNHPIPPSKGYFSSFFRFRILSFSSYFKSLVPVAAPCSLLFFCFPQTALFHVLFSLHFALYILLTSLHDYFFLFFLLSHNHVSCFFSLASVCVPPPNHLATHFFSLNRLAQFIQFTFFFFYVHPIPITQ